MPDHEIGDAVAVNIDLLTARSPQRHTGTVTAVHADGQITAEFPQPGFGPIEVSGPAEHFIAVRTERLDDEVRQLRIELDKAQRERDSLARRCAVRFEETQKLRGEVEHHERRYLAAQKVLDGAIGTKVEDGTGEGMVADLALLAQRYADLKARTISGGWPLVVEEVEAAELRATATRPSLSEGGDRA